MSGLGISAPASKVYKEFDPLAPEIINVDFRYFKIKLLPIKH